MTIHTPISESEAEQFELSSYVLFTRTQHCRHCQEIWNFSDLHEVWTHPTKTAITNAKVLKTARFIAPGFELAIVNTPIVDVPICQSCVGNAALAAARTFPPLSYSSWATTIQRKAQSAITEKRGAATARAKPTPTLDQL